MRWKPYQQFRLAQERQVLQRHAPAFEFYEPTGNTYVSGWTTSNLDRSYALCIMLPAAFPDVAPDTYISSPSPLLGYRGLRTIDSYGNSHDMHVWKSDRPDWTKLCIVHPDSWSAEYTIYKVIIKAKLWIAAYESHLDDGRNIADFLI